jgi:TIR domain
MSAKLLERAFIFVSHSNDDLPHVRVVRNYLEREGAHPLLFFLQSKTDDAELAPLIADEITARQFFLYCRSEAAEKSDWVKSERETARSSGKKEYVIDLDCPLRSIPKTMLDRILRRASVVMWHARSDRRAVTDLIDAMRSDVTKLPADDDVLPDLSHFGMMRSDKLSSDRIRVAAGERRPVSTDHAFRLIDDRTTTRDDRSWFARAEQASSAADTIVLAMSRVNRTAFNQTDAQKRFKALAGAYRHRYIIDLDSALDDYPDWVRSLEFVFVPGDLRAQARELVAALHRDFRAKSPERD